LGSIFSRFEWLWEGLSLRLEWKPVGLTTIHVSVPRDHVIVASVDFEEFC
jgi:hypothetical protein